MKRVVAAVAVFVLILGSVAPGHAGGRHGDWGGARYGGCCWWMPHVIIGSLVLGAVSTVVAAATYPPYPVPPPVVYQPAPVYATPAPVYATQRAPVYAAPPAPAPPVQREVVYPHGRYVLYGNGVTQPWQWVWIAAAPVPPPPPAPSQ